jgi:hypothetical protein
MPPTSATRISVIEKKFEMIIHVFHPCENVLFRPNKAFPSTEWLVAGFPFMPDLKTEETLFLG